MLGFEHLRSCFVDACLQIVDFLLKRVMLRRDALHARLGLIKRRLCLSHAHSASSRRNSGDEREREHTGKHQPTSAANANSARAFYPLGNKPHGATCMLLLGAAAPLVRLQTRSPD